MTLFNADDYTDKGAALKRKRANKPLPVEVFDTVASHVWHLVQQRHPGVVHADRNVIGADDPPGSHRTYCGVYATPLTFDPGQRVNGCLACLHAMQRMFDP